MNRELKNFRAAERWIVKKLRMWLDRADEIVHGWEVRVRQERVSVDSVSVRRSDATVPERQPVRQRAVAWPATSEIQGERLVGETNEGTADSPRDHKAHDAVSFLPPKKRKRRMTAAEFDLDIRNRVMARAGAL